MTDLAEDLKAAAHDYRSRGWRVIQLHKVGPDGKTCSCRKGANCTSAGKHPRDEAWQNTEPYSAADIEALWDGMMAKANIGLATGDPSGFWVLDIDPTGGGFESMKALVAEHGPLPQTFVVGTGSGGYHYYFAMPDFPLRNTQGRVGKGIDTRATGGQVVAAPSVSSKGVYTVVSDFPLAQAPDWLLEVSRKTEVDPSTIVTANDLPKPEDIAPEEWERLNRYAKSVIDDQIARLDRLKQTGWDGEPWNATTFQVACTLLEFANSPWNAYSADHARNDVMSHAPRDNDGFDDYVVRRTFESAQQKVGAQARPVPEDRSNEPDPLFDNPDIRQRPTEGDGEPTGLVVRDREVTEFDFFDGKDLLAAKLAHAITQESPIGWGRDNDFWSYQAGVWRPDHYVVMNRVIRALGDRYRPGHYATVKDIARYQALYLSGDPDEHRINFTNGMLDWRTGELTEHSPTFGSTVQMGTAWDADAVCPQFERFLADILHEDYVNLAWEMIGYLMMSGNPQQVAFMFYGDGGNGKGTLLRVIQELIGQENVSSESLDDLNSNRFRTASLFGKIANIAGDIDATYQEHTSTFKKITGEDLITAEHKNMNPFKFTSWAVPLFSANEFPGSADVTRGYLRRWIILNFHKQISDSQRVLGLSDLLTQELPGIAAKGVRALRPLMEREEFLITGEAEKGREDFAVAIDPVRQWLASGSVLQSPGSASPLLDLYTAYGFWAERTGRRKINEVKFSHRLKSVGYPPEVMGGLTYHQGLRADVASTQQPGVLTVETMFDEI